MREHLPDFVQVREINYYLSLHNGKWSKAVQKHKGMKVAKFVRLCSPPPCPAPPRLLAWSLLSSVKACVSLWCGWEQAGRLEMSRSVLKFLTHSKDICIN